MAKDDYFPMLYKLLKYLYRCLKEDRKPDFNILAPKSKDFPVGDDYFFFLLSNALKDGLISGLAIQKQIGRRETLKETTGLKITPAGIAYLEENSLMRKVGEHLGSAAEIVETVIEHL